MQNSHIILICAALAHHSRLQRDHIREKKKDRCVWYRGPWGEIALHSCDARSHSARVS